MVGAGKDVDVGMGPLWLPVRVLPLFSLVEMYWPLWLPIRTGDNASFVSKSVFLDIWKSII